MRSCISRAVMLSMVVGAMVIALPGAAAWAQSPGDASHQKAQALATAVTEAVYAMPQFTAFSNVEFHITADGVVNLTGMAAEKELKSNICGVVEKVDGVTECVNNLYQLGTSQIDRELRVKIYDSIYSKYLSDYATVGFGQRAAGGNRAMGQHPIQIIEDKQHVYLYGWVYSEADKASATEAARVVPGVADVKNYLRVVPKPASQ